MSKLTAKQVREILRRFVDGDSQCSLAVEFGISRGHIDGLLRGDTWSHLPLESLRARARAILDSHKRGEAHVSAKLTEAQVREIHNRYCGGETSLALAHEYGVKETYISSIVLGKSWKHLRLPPAAPSISGENARWSRLTNAQVRGAMEAYLGGASYPEIAEQYGIPKPQVGGIVTGKKWLSVARDLAPALRAKAEKPKAGEDHPRAKLDESKVSTIKQRFTAGERASVLGREYGVSAGLIRQIMIGKIWNHVLQELTISPELKRKPGGYHRLNL